MKKTNTCGVNKPLGLKLVEALQGKLAKWKNKLLTALQSVVFTTASSISNLVFWFFSLWWMTKVMTLLIALWLFFQVVDFYYFKVYGVDSIFFHR